MIPTVVPVKPTLAQPESNFRARLLAGKVKKAADNKATVHLPLEVDENYLIVRIPRNMKYSDLRTKDAFTDEAGKLHKEAAMVTINTLAVKDLKGSDYTMSFTDDETGKRLDMAVRPNLTMNLSCDYGTVQVFDAETGEPVSE